MRARLRDSSRASRHAAPRTCLHARRVSEGTDRALCSASRSAPCGSRRYRPQAKTDDGPLTIVGVVPASFVRACCRPRPATATSGSRRYRSFESKIRGSAIGGRRPACRIPIETAQAELMRRPAARRRIPAHQRKTGACLPSCAIIWSGTSVSPSGPVRAVTALIVRERRQLCFARLGARARDGYCPLWRAAARAAVADREPPDRDDRRDSGAVLALDLSAITIGPVTVPGSRRST